MTYNFADEIKAAFPLKLWELDGLHKAGWSSGFGAMVQPDWFHEPSSGDPIFITEDSRFGTNWLSDLEFVRTQRANELKKKNGPELFAMLEECLGYFEDREDVNWHGDGPNDAMRIAMEIREVLAKTLAGKEQS